MDVVCSSNGAVKFKEECIIGTSEWNPFFSECCSACNIYFQALTPSTELLQGIITGTGTNERKFRKNIRVYDKKLSMSCFTANWIHRGPGSSCFSPTMTIQGVYNYIGALVPPQWFSPELMYVYINDTYFVTQVKVRQNEVTVLDPNITTIWRHFYMIEIHTFIYSNVYENVWFQKKFSPVSRCSLTQIGALKLIMFEATIDCTLQR